MTKKKDKSFKDVSARVAVDELEKSILGWWEDNKIFAKSLKRAEGKPRFTFYDGPPYATGKPHYGHILQSAIKDTVLRYKTMRGYYVPRRVGWDCHGLPVETLVEKEIGFKTKKEIEDYGIGKFNKRCRQTVFRYIDEFTNTLKRMGRWADYDSAWATLNPEYMETEWWVFKQLWNYGLIYKAFRSTPYCIRCETPLSNFEVSINYKDTVDTAVYVMLPVKGQNLSRKGDKSTHKQLALLVWTTTPWTLPGNAAVAVSPALEYASVEYKGRELIVAKERTGEVFGKRAKAIKSWSKEELLGLEYEPLYELKTKNGKQKIKNAYRVVESDHVGSEEGTGLVHIAPAFGEEDAELGEAEGLPVLRTVEVNGVFSKDVPNWPGENIFDANKKIVADLDQRGLLFKSEQYKHNYPFCWRCESPLIYYALDTWFVRISKIKERMIKVAEQISWTPKHVKKGRFGKGLESAPDWAVSRNRFWSVPLPVWECTKCKHQVCVGSISELEELSGLTGINDMHRPYVDEISWRCSECGQGEMRRVEEVLDVWFDAGCMPYAQSHYPFENKDLVEASFPADFIVEMIEQTRLWFYVLHVLAVALTEKDIGLGKDSPAFLNAVGSGLIFAEDGRKLSKRLKNYLAIDPTIKKYGADVLRLYLLSSSTLGEPYRFSEKDLKKLQSNTYMTLWNVYSFFVRYANTHGWHKHGETASRQVLDRWIIARLKQLKVEVLKATESYQIDKAAREFLPFIDDLSNWYVRRSRGRFQKPEGGKEADESFGTLYTVLVEISRLAAPYLPYLAEEIFRNLTDKESVHLERLSDAEGLVRSEKDLLLEMKKARAIVTEGLALRAKQGIKVRQPLAELAVREDKVAYEIQDMIKDEVNVKKVRFTKKLLGGAEFKESGDDARIKAAINTRVSPELKEEGIAREIIRHGQIMRREAGYELDDRVELIITTESDEITKAIKKHEVMLKEALQADGLTDEAGAVDVSGTVALGNAEVQVGLRRK